MARTICMVCKRQTLQTHHDDGDDPDLCSYCKGDILDHFRRTFPIQSPEGRATLADIYHLHLYKE